jgi:hypothetical protein
MNRRRLAFVRERPRPRWALGIVCVIVLYAVVRLLSVPILAWVHRAGDAHQERAGGYTITE